MDAIGALYESGLSIREVARRTGVAFSTARKHLIVGGWYRAKYKRICDGFATCNGCGVRKAMDRFPQLAYGKYRCDECLRAANDVQQLRRQSCTADEYRAFAEAQNSRCAICGGVEGHRSRYGKVCRLAVDHDHRTGQVRGLLCNNCNRGLGRFKDSIENLQAAIRYLKRGQ